MILLIVIVQIPTVDVTARPILGTQSLAAPRGEATTFLVAFRIRGASPIPQKVTGIQDAVKDDIHKEQYHHDHKDNIEGWIP